MWVIETFESVLVEGAHEFELARHVGGDEAVVLIEQLAGERGAFQAEVANMPGEQLSPYGRTRVFMGRIADDAQVIGLRLVVGVTSLVRITIATIRSGAANAFKQLPCRICKKLVNLLLTAALALVGVPYLDGNVIFDDDLMAALKGLLDNPAYATFAKLVEEIDLGIWDGILAAAAGIEFVFDLADRFYQMVCQRLGMCPAVT